jgi:hypothetical protein
MTMKRFIVGAFALASISVGAIAHDFATVFPTRGACEAALAKTNNEDRDAFFEFFASKGDAMQFFHLFKCVKANGGWMQVFTG